MDTANTAVQRSQRLRQAGAQWAQRLSEDPDRACLTYVVEGRGQGTVASDIRAGTHTLRADEPQALAGDNSGASPVEIALSALISCQIVVYRLYAENLGIQVDDIDVTAEGDLNVKGLFGMEEDVRPGFQAVRLHVDITGPESNEKYEQLRQTVDAHCPVFDLFRNDTPVETDIAVNRQGASD